MKTFKIEIVGLDDDLLWQEVEGAGGSPLYGEEGEKGTQILYFRADERTLVALAEALPTATVSDWELPAIDWEEQWRLHGQGFQDGELIVDLSDFGYPELDPVVMVPGAGFGDLSHPTTRLVIRLMGDIVKDRLVLDLGCGSGVLALCAARLGAKQVIAVDIDTEALEHTRENAVKNGLTEVIRCCRPEELAALKEPVTLVMNMITSEQVVAWQSLAVLESSLEEAVLSGVLLTEREEYVKNLFYKNLDVVDTEVEGEWIAFRCKKGKGAEADRCNE